MNSEIKRAWVAALRSGTYKQGQARLRTKDDGFCCLGVLQDLYIKAKNLEWEKDLHGEYITPHLHAAGCLDVNCKIWSELGTQNPSVMMQMDDNSLSLRSLASINDTANLSFGEIADLIEKDDSL